MFRQTIKPLPGPVAQKYQRAQAAGTGGRFLTNHPKFAAQQVPPRQPLQPKQPMQPRQPVAQGIRQNMPSAVNLQQQPATQQQFDTAWNQFKQPASQEMAGQQMSYNSTGSPVYTEEVAALPQQQSLFGRTAKQINTLQQPMAIEQQQALNPEDQQYGQV